MNKPKTNTNPKDVEFRRHFGTRDMFQDRMVTMVTGRYSLDIIKFDAWMHTHHHYTEEDHGSLQDFIQSKFGQAACDFISGLL